MPTLKYRTVQTDGNGFLSGRTVQQPYWENDAAVSSASTQAVTNDDLKPNDELNLIKKKKRRGLTVPLDLQVREGLSTVLGSIGINVPQ